MALIKKLLPLLFVFGVFLSPVQAKSDNNFFYGETCPHCHDALEWFDATNLLDHFDINLREVWNDRQNALLFINQMSALGQPLDGNLPVPILIFEDQIIVGSTPIINFFKAKQTNGEWSESLNPSSSEITPEIPLVSSDHTFWNFLPALTFAALADAVNPCAFAVLILLLVSILAAGDRIRALKAGFAFTFAIFLSYLAMGFGLFSALATLASTQIISTTAGILAIILGLFNLKDFFWYGKGFKMEVPESWRSSMKLFLAKATSPFGAFLIGFVISLFLLPCTSGPYIVILGLLSESATFTCASQCLVFYNAIFVIPMLIITLAVFWGLSPQHLEKFRQHHLRTSHLIIGILLLLIGLWALWG